MSLRAGAPETAPARVLRASGNEENAMRRFPAVITAPRALAIAAPAGLPEGIVHGCMGSAGATGSASDVAAVRR
jgi:hypothetical protein